MVFLFDGYTPADAPRAGEPLAKGAILVREVQIGDEMRLYFDGDFHPAIRIPAQDFFVCRER